MMPVESGVDVDTVAARVPMLLREPDPIEMRYYPPVLETVDILQERYTPHEFDRAIYSDQDVAIGEPFETYLVLKTDRTTNNQFEDDHLFVPSGDRAVVGD